MDRECLQQAFDAVNRLERSLDSVYWTVLGVSEPETGWTNEEAEKLTALLNYCTCTQVWLKDSIAIIRNMCNRWGDVHE